MGVKALYSLFKCLTVQSLETQRTQNDSSTEGSPGTSGLPVHAGQTGFNETEGRKSFNVLLQAQRELWEHKCGTALSSPCFDVNWEGWLTGSDSKKLHLLSFCSPSFSARHWTIWYYLDHRYWFKQFFYLNAFIVLCLCSQPNERDNASGRREPPVLGRRQNVEIKQDKINHWGFRF